MTLKDWEENRWLRRHASSREEVAGLLSVVDRDEYDHAGGATDGDADELLKFGKELRKDVLEWLSRHYPDLVPKP